MPELELQRVLHRFMEEGTGVPPKVARDLLFRAVHGVAERHDRHKIPTKMDMGASRDTRFTHSRRWA